MFEAANNGFCLFGLLIFSLEGLFVDGTYIKRGVKQGLNFHGRAARNAKETRKFFF